MSQELDALLGIASKADAEALEITGPAPGQELPEAEPAGPDYMTEAAGAVDLFAAALGGYCEKAGELWTEEKRAKVAEAVAPVMEKYGFSFGACPPELTLAVVAGPLLWQTAKVVASEGKKEQERAEQIEMRKRADARQHFENTRGLPAGSIADDGPHVAPEVPVHPQMKLYQ